MTDTSAQVLQLVDAGAFLLVGLLAVRDWWRGRERRRGYLAMALGALGLVALGGALEPLLGHPANMARSLVILFMLSAAALLLYRHSVVPLPRWVLWGAGLGLTGVTAVSFVAGVPQLAGRAAAPTPPQLAAIDALLGAWLLAVAEPAYRLARIARSLPAVQRARIRSIAAGYAGVLVVVGLIAVSSTIPGHLDAVYLDALTLACIPPLYAGFAPPAWLRRLWRRREEDRLRSAIGDLLLYSPDRATLAGRGLDWAIRLVGGDAGLVTDGNGELLATRGITAAEAHRLLELPELHSSAPLVRLDGRSRTAILHALPVQSGTGILAVLSGSLSPVFDVHEADWLAGYAASLSIALDRVRVAELSAQTEAELRSARDLAEAASQAKSEFLSRASHELRTPLTAMIGFAELLLTESLDPRQEHHVRTILRAGGHLLALVDEILDVSRSAEGRISLSTEPVSIEKVVEEVVELTRPMAVDRGMRVGVTRIAASLNVIADRQRLQQVLLNLVTNAIKYNRPGGRVEIGAAAVDGHGRLSVRDSGPGIRRDEMERLFAPFERLSNATSEVEGTGLGLALSKSLTEAMGGSIGVESRVGRGSTFWVRLPLAEAADIVGRRAGAVQEPART